MSGNAEHDEEREALQSIYEGDGNFKEIDPTTFQYKYGEEDNYKAFLVEIKWGPNYPGEAPEINMDTFYNRNLIPAVKKKIESVLIEESQQWLGCGMTYTLFECLKDRLDELTEDQPEHTTTVSQSIESTSSAIKIADTEDATKKKEVKKEQLSKAQKRRQWERTDHKGEKPRGWDWVDIVKHLSQTGGKDKSSANDSSNQHVLEPLNG